MAECSATGWHESPHPPLGTCPAGARMLQHTSPPFITPFPSLHAAALARLTLGDARPGGALCTGLTAWPLATGPTMAGGEKEQDPRLIPVPANTTLGFFFVTNIDSSDPDQLVWTNLIVGAPYFFERQEEFGGAVYVYSNRGSLGWGLPPPALRLPDSMFGDHLAVLGDLNQDGFQVSDCLLLLPRDIRRGGSLRWGWEVFTYHGQPGACHHRLPRARPVIRVSHEVSILLRTIDLEQPNYAGGHSVCMDLRVCFSYVASPSSYSPVVALDYTLDGDTDRRLRGQVPLVIFLSRGPDDPKHQASGTMWLKRQRDGVCGDTTLQLQVHAAPLAPEEKPMCLSNGNASHVECELGNPMKRGARLQIPFTFYLILSTPQGSPLRPQRLEVELLLATISEQELRPVSARARASSSCRCPSRGKLPAQGHPPPEGVAIPQQLFFSGVVRGESAMRSERDVGSKVKYEVTVSNHGQSLNTLGSAFLNIMWPHEIANGKWLLYPMRVELEGGQGPGQKGLCSPRPNALYLDVDSRDRRRRELGQPEQPEPREQPEPSTSWWPVSSAEKKNVILVRCAQARPLHGVQLPSLRFDRAAVLHVWGRLGTATFLENCLHGVMVYLDPVAVVAEGVPCVVILLAVLAGLLVLALLVLLNVEAICTEPLPCTYQGPCRARRVRR
ncbi:Integrin alpha-7 [Camelus dromedarius]|uniref:Integrin alpha-7 n=1 Tax=Camelus dromedarius TaxID=9838 RepID=A0A5N4DEN1_CAMDR|nr:Integrin alpha-7 [Camelus dromedarius]